MNNTKLHNLKKSLLIVLAAGILAGCESKNENINVSLSSTSTQIYNGVAFTINISVNGEITKADYYFDGQSIGSVIQSPYSIQITLKDINPGIHKLKCIVTSAKGAEYSGEIDVNLKLRLGDEFKGGVVFYLNDTGDHGLIASKEDLASYRPIGLYWGQSGSLNTSKDNGQENTVKLANVAINDNYVGYYFKNGYNFNGYTDWYVPSINELKILKENKDLVGGFQSGSDWRANYWSSSELSATNAEALHFNVLMGNSYGKQQYALVVRPIRKF